MDQVRVLRILEYVGDRKWVEETLAKGSVPTNGQRSIGTAGVIKSAILGEFPEILESKEERVDETNKPVAKHD